VRRYIILIITLFYCFVNAEIVNLNPTDDMYTDPDHAGVSPEITQLWTANYSPAGHFERIMIKFDLSGYDSDEINSATLHLTRFFSCPSSGTSAVNFYPINQEWYEDSWDHTQHITYDETICKPYVFSGDGGSAINQFQIDVTEFIKVTLQADLSEYGFVILAESNQKFSKFYSKEFTNSDYIPSLELELEESSYENETVSSPIKFHQNFPNPFNPTTKIKFAIDKASPVKLSIYDIQGKKVKELTNNFYEIGEYELVWHGRNEKGDTVASGVYFYCLETPFQSYSRKMILLK
jgi:hypothetical protein